MRSGWLALFLVAAMAAPALARTHEATARAGIGRLCDARTLPARVCEDRALWAGRVVDECRKRLPRLFLGTSAFARSARESFMGNCVPTALDVIEDRFGR